jgi:hypothetical protein
MTGMTEIPMEWIDKLFNCMQLFYGERWDAIINYNNRKDQLKTVWKNGLQGLTYEQIKDVLIHCKRHAQDKSAQPPHVMEFFRYAKGHSQLDINYSSSKQENADPEVARFHLDKIRKITQNYIKA